MNVGHELDAVHHIAAALMASTDLAFIQKMQSRLNGASYRPSLSLWAMPSGNTFLCQPLKKTAADNCKRGVLKPPAAHHHYFQKKLPLIAHGSVHTAQSEFDYLVDRPYSAFFFIDALALWSCPHI